MKTCKSETFENLYEPFREHAVDTAPAKSSFLYLVSNHDLEDMRDTLAKGALPLDFEAKLRNLRGDSIVHRAVEQNCRLFVALLFAAQTGSFSECSLANQERLLRVLAYVHKDDDAIPDYKPRGFLDDQREVRAVVTELAPLLAAFKAWHLRNQVPGLWSP